MASIVQRLYDRHQLPALPKFVGASVQYEVLMGSVAYGIAEETSDFDVYAVCIPPRDYVFPHLRGEIPGFSPPGPRFEHFEQHRVMDPSAQGGEGRRYDLTVYSIVRFFRLCADNNPNLIDTLFVPRRCVLYSTPLGERVREQRHLFLHKGAWHKFKGYAYAQMHKMRTQKPVGGRKAMVEEYGYDLKFASHVVRLLNEVEQILAEGDLDLERNREQLKAIRRGEWTQAQVERYFETKERELEAAYTASRLPATPDLDAIQSLLLSCLAQHYGSLDGCITHDDDALRALRDIDAVLDRVRGLLR